MAQPASGHQILSGERVHGIVEGIGRNAVDTRDVMDDKRGVIEDGLAAADGLLEAVRIGRSL